VELVIMGSTRHDEDIRLLDSLRDEVTTLGLQDHVRFVANAPYSELQRYMQQALIGLHTMWNEHFGISIVEMMAAGLIVVAHNSGGPRLDIVPDSAGNADLANGKADCCSMLFDDVLDIPQPCCKCLQRANTRHSLFEGGATTKSRALLIVPYICSCTIPFSNALWYCAYVSTNELHSIFFAQVTWPRPLPSMPKRSARRWTNMRTTRPCGSGPGSR
jgi:hypothetical protein